MKQGTLWELDQQTDSVTNAMWGRLDATVKTNVKTKLSALMVRTVRPNQDPAPSEKENKHE